jgi:hydrocephalus-inducing protein
MPGQSVDVAYIKPRITEFLNIGDYSINRESCVPIEEPLFEPIPSVIRFTDYEPLQIKSMVFKLRNKDSVARTVRIIQPESRLFQVSLYSSERSAHGEEVSSVSGSKVAPGLEVKYLIKFSPEAKSDYNYDLHIVTEREKFIVPILAIGKRAMIDFPDTINFGRECPVKYVTEKPVIIRNLGDKTTKWELQLEPGFSADKKEGVLEFGRSEQIILKFYPVDKRLYESEAVLRYDGMEAYIPMTGNAINGNVYLSKKLVKLGESYLRLKNQRTIEIVNKSDVKIDFEWRTFKTENEESEKKQAIKDHLDQEEQVQRLMMRDAAAMEDNHELLDIQDDDDSGYEEVDERTLMLTNQKKAELMLQRRYKSIKKSIEENLFLFEHDIFDIKPVTGTIWPKSEMTITITFRPTQALEYFTHAYCNISCSDERLPLTLEGTGLGPKAYLSVSTYNIKEVCVNERKEVPFYIENKGDIPAEFKLLKNNTPFSKMIDFDVKEGVLEVGSKISFNMTFQSSKVGEFQEVFRWAITDSRDELTLHVRGHVRAPEFEFKENRIDFGVVSYQFEKIQEIELENKSQVKFKFNLRIPGDNKNNEKEFEISPESDEIKPGETRKIQVKFMPHQKKPYNMVMVLDIDGVGKDMKSIPIQAISEAPKVHLKDPFINYGNIFLRDPQERTITLVNSSPLPARFKVMPQSPETQMIGKIHTEPEEGIIAAGSHSDIKVTLTTLSILEHVQLELGIKIIANEDKPLIVKITAKSEGPKVDVLESIIDFKEVNVLEERSEFVHIKNNSSINAGFYAFTKKKDSVFKPIQRHHNLDVNQSMEIEIVCNADDEGIFTDVLHIVIKEGIDKEVKLKAKATGKTIFCNNDLDKGIDFGTQYTFKHQTKEIFIENKGRRDQKLEWVRKKPDKKKEDEDKNKLTTRKPKEEEEPTPTFSIFPESRLLPKKTGSMFQFRAVSTKKGKSTETFILQSTIEGDRKPKKLYEVVVSGDFINPKLNFDMTNIEFIYDWVKGIPPKIISQNIGITCDSVLPTKFKLLIEKPFMIYPDSFDLSAYKKVTARLDFDPNYNTSKRSCVEPRQLKVKHSKHPFVEAIDVIGMFNFPNLELETHEINFGSVLNDTSKKILMKMKNVSKMNVEYMWSFLDEESREGKDTIPINEIFDILPLNGTLEPNQIEQVEFVYYGLPGRRFEAKAVCQIEGGPDEKVTLIGESSKIEYLLIFPNSTTKNEIEFKEIPFSQWAVKEFFIQNLGKVPFDFKVKTDNITRKGLLYITPSTGKIAGGGKSRVRVHFCPGLPGDYLEKFKIQVAHFEAETIYLRGYGQYPALKFELNREVTDDIRKKIEDEGQLIDNISIDSQTSSITKKFPEAEVISRLDRKILADAVMKNIEDRAKGIGSLNNSLVVDNKEDLTLAAIPAELKEDDAAGPNTQTNLANTTAKSGFMRNTVGNKFERHLYDNIVVGRYLIDLGNVIAGNTAQYQFRVYNVGKMPQSTIIFDTKNLRPFGFKLSTDRVILKNKDKNFEDIRLWFTTNSKKGSTGRITYELPIEIENGPKYIIEIRANVTVPELGFSDQEVNFGKVICGQKKTITLRISNDREVECNWTILQKKEQKKKHNEPRNENKFTIVPSSGMLGCFCKQNIEITFIPTADKTYQSIFEVTMEDNQKKIELLCLGLGIVPMLQFIPEEMIFDPCLPYDNNVYKCLEVKNPSEFDIEFFSLDFDKQYLEEDKIMAAYEPLQRPEGVSLSVRKPGDLLWPEMRNYYAVFSENQKLNSAISLIRDNKDLPEDEKVAKIAELEKDRKILKEETKYPMAIEESTRRYVVVWGPKKCGKSQLCKTLAEKHQRGQVNFNEIFEWNINANTPAAIRAKEYLQKRAEEKEVMLAEKEKLRKKQPKRKGQEEENLYLERYEWLSDEILAALVRERLKSKDCNAGAVFDNLFGNFFENELVALKAILEACQVGMTQLVHVKPTAERHGLPTCNIIDPADMLENEKEQELEGQPKEEKKKNKPLVDRRVIQMNKKVKEQAIKEKRSNKDKANKDPADPAATTDEPAEQPPIDPTQKFFEVDEILDMSKEEREAYFKKAQELIDYFLGKLSDEYIHKLEAHLKKLEEEEEAKNPKNKTKDGQKKASNKPSRPDTASKLSDTSPKLIPDYTGKRELTEIDLCYNYKQLNLSVLKLVPKVIFPDPVTLPLPEHQVLQLLKKREARKVKPKLESFEIFTPAESIKEDVIEKMLESEFKDEKEQVRVKVQSIDESIEKEKEIIKQEKTAMLLRDLEEKRLIAADQGIELPPRTDADIPAIPESELDSILIKELRQEKAKLVEDLESRFQKRKRDLQSQNSVPFTPETLQKVYRWIVPKGKSIVLVLKFFSKKTGEYQAVLDFENIYSNGKLNHYKVKALCDFPRISTNPEKIFTIRKQFKQPNIPEALQKVYFKDEDKFDFGPLLIGKKSKDKNDKKVLAVNSATFDIVNEGCFKANINFDLGSNVAEDGNHKKGIFSIHPNHMELKPGDTEKIRVWCVPDEVRLYTDDLVCMMEHNPAPFVVRLEATGASPVLSTLQKVIEFDRLLLNQTFNKELVLKNIGMIPAKWKIIGIENLPPEFKIEPTSGELRPTKETSIQIKFSSSKQLKFEHEIRIVASDVEEIGINQEPLVKLFNQANYFKVGSLQYQRQV